MIKPILLIIPQDKICGEKVAGYPLIIRQLIHLKRFGIEKVSLLLPNDKKNEFEKAIADADRDLPNVEFYAYNIKNSEINFEGAEFLTNTEADSFTIIDSRLILTPEIIKILFVERQNASCKYNENLLAYTTVEKSLVKEIIHSLIFEKHFGNPVFNVTELPADAIVAAKLNPLEIEKLLMKAIRNKAPGPISKYLNKSISLPISIRLARKLVHPNYISFINIIIGISTGFVMAGGSYWHFLAGAIVFQVASIADGCDGELAKLTIRTSKFGEYVDTFSDNSALLSFFTGLIIGQWRATGSSVVFIVFALLMFGIAITVGHMISFLKKEGKSASLAVYNKVYLQRIINKNKKLAVYLKVGKFFLQKDGFSFAFLIMAIFGILPYVIYIAAIGANMAAGTLYLLHRKYPIFEKNN